jgi:hypothetical protein
LTFSSTTRLEPKLASVVNPYFQSAARATFPPYGFRGGESTLRYLALGLIGSAVAALLTVTLLWPRPQ